MPTLENPSRYFGYSRKPYDSYFQRPPPSDPYGQIGNEERQFQAEQKVMGLLGQMDALEVAKQDRDFMVANAAQERALREEAKKQQYAKIGQLQRQQETQQALSQIDPRTEEGAAALAEMYRSSPPDVQAIILNHSSAQSRILPADMYGGERQYREQQEKDALKQRNKIERLDRTKRLVNEAVQYGATPEDLSKITNPKGGMRDDDLARLIYTVKKRERAAELEDKPITESQLMDGASNYSKAASVLEEIAAKMAKDPETGVAPALTDLAAKDQAAYAKAISDVSLFKPYYEEAIARQQKKTGKKDEEKPVAGEPKKGKVVKLW